MLQYNILNPQTPIPDVKSNSTVIGQKVEEIDLNEDSWSKEYFVVFFHTGPHDPVSTYTMKCIDKHNDDQSGDLPCKVVGVSVDSPHTVSNWLNSEEDLKEFDVPLMSDRNANICRQFGVYQESSGYPANSVFIIDGNDRVRYHCVLDSRVGFNIEEITRLVKAFKETDGGKTLAMEGWKSKEDNVGNDIDSVKHFYAKMFGDDSTKFWEQPLFSKGNFTRRQAVMTLLGILWICLAFYLLYTIMSH